MGPMIHITLLPVTLDAACCSVSTMPLPASAAQLLLCRCIAGPALDDRDEDVSKHCRRCNWSISLDLPFSLSDAQMLFAVVLDLQQRVSQLENEAALAREAHHPLPNTGRPIIYTSP